MCSSDLAAVINSPFIHSLCGIQNARLRLRHSHSCILASSRHSRRLCLVTFCASGEKHELMFEGLEWAEQIWTLNLSKNLCVLLAVESELFVL